MAHPAPLKNKDGIVYGYQIKVYRGRDANGKQLKPYSTVWRIPEGMKNQRTIEDNVLCVRRSQVMHTRCCTISDYFLVPLQVGEFKIQCTCICEELSEEQTFIIPVSVVSQ